MKPKTILTGITATTAFVASMGASVPETTNNVETTKNLRGASDMERNGITANLSSNSGIAPANPIIGLNQILRGLKKDEKVSEEGNASRDLKREEEDKAQEKAAKNLKKAQEKAAKEAKKKAEEEQKKARKEKKELTKAKKKASEEAKKKAKEEQKAAKKAKKKAQSDTGGGRRDKIKEGEKS